MGGSPHLISEDDIPVIIAAAIIRPEKLGPQFTHWSLCEFAVYLAVASQPVILGRERPRQILHAGGISFQRTGPGKNPVTWTGTPPTAGERARA